MITVEDCIKKQNFVLDCLTYLGQLPTYSQAASGVLPQVQVSLSSPVNSFSFSSTMMGRPSPAMASQSAPTAGASYNLWSSGSHPAATGMSLQGGAVAPPNVNIGNITALPPNISIQNIGGLQGLGLQTAHSGPPVSQFFTGFMSLRSILSYFLICTPIGFSLNYIIL